MVEKKIIKVAILSVTVDATKQNNFILLPIFMVLQGLYIRWQELWPYCAGSKEKIFCCKEKPPGSVFMPWKKLHSINLNWMLATISMMMNENNGLYLLIHTMTITECDYVLQAQYFHTFSNGMLQNEGTRFVGRRFRFRLNPYLRTNRNKPTSQRLCAPSLKTLMKRNSNRIRHHLRAVHMYVSLCMNMNIKYLFT